jgi:hypothetical protein
MSTPAELLEALGREARARLGGGGDGPTRVYRGRTMIASEPSSRWIWGTSSSTERPR